MSSFKSIVEGALVQAWPHWRAEVTLKLNSAAPVVDVEAGTITADPTEVTLYAVRSALKEEKDERGTDSVQTRSYVFYIRNADIEDEELDPSTIDSVVDSDGQEYSVSSTDHDGLKVLHRLYCEKL